MRLECAQTTLFLVLLIDYCPHRHLFTGLCVDGFSLSIIFVENLVVVCFFIFIFYILCAHPYKVIGVIKETKTTKE